jgi:hypothetical protein
MMPLRTSWGLPPCGSVFLEGLASTKHPRWVVTVLDPLPAQNTLALPTAGLYITTRIFAEGHNVKMSLETPLAPS